MNHIMTQYSDRFAAVFIVVIVSVSVVFGVLPLVDAIRTARIAIEKEQIAQNVYMQSETHKERMQQEQKIIAKNAALVPMLPTQTQIIALVEQLEHMADERAITARFAALTDDQIILIAQKKRAKDEAKAQTAEKTNTASAQTNAEKYFAITLTGVFEDVAGFISAIEHAEYYIFMDTVTIVPQRQIQKAARGTGVVLAVPTSTISRNSVPEVDDAQHVTATIEARIPFKEEVGETL